MLGIIFKFEVRIHGSTKANSTDIGGVPDHLSSKKPCIKEFLNHHVVWEPALESQVTPNLDLGVNSVLRLRQTPRQSQDDKGCLHERDEEVLVEDFSRQGPRFGTRLPASLRNALSCIAFERASSPHHHHHHRRRHHHHHHIKYNKI